MCASCVLPRKGDQMVWVSVQFSFVEYDGCFLLCTSSSRKKHQGSAHKYLSIAGNLHQIGCFSRKHPWVLPGFFFLWHHQISMGDSVQMDQQLKHVLHYTIRVSSPQDFLPWFPYHVVVRLEGQGTARTDVLTFPFQLANHREHGIAILSQLQEIEDEAVGSVCHLRLTVRIRLTIDFTKSFQHILT